MTEMLPATVKGFFCKSSFQKDLEFLEERFYEEQSMLGENTIKCY